MNILFELTNSNLSACCQICYDAPECLSWTLFYASPSVSICRLFRDYRPNSMISGGYQSGFTSRYIGIYKFFLKLT